MSFFVPYRVLRYKTKKSGPYQTSVDNRIFGNQSALLPKGLEEVELFIEEAHGRVFTEKDSVSIKCFPEGSIVSTMGRFGKLLRDRDSSSQGSYCSYRWERECFWVKRSPEARKCNSWQELTGRARIGDIPNIQFGKLSPNNKSIGTSAEHIFPQLFVGDSRDDVMGMSVRAYKRKALIMTPHRKERVTMEDVGAMATQWRKNGIFEIKEFIFQACQAEPDPEAERLGERRSRKYIEKFWQQLSAKGIDLPAVIPDKVYKDAEFMVARFILGDMPATEEDPYQDKRYSAENNPSIGDSAEWELVFPDGSFREGSDANVEAVQGRYQE